MKRVLDFKTGTGRVRIPEGSNMAGYRGRIAEFRTLDGGKTFEIKLEGSSTWTGVYGNAATIGVYTEPDGKGGYMFWYEEVEVRNYQITLHLEVAGQGRGEHGRAAQEVMTGQIIAALGDVPVRVRVMDFTASEIGL